MQPPERQKSCAVLVTYLARFNNPHFSNTPNDPLDWPHLLHLLQSALLPVLEDMGWLQRVCPPKPSLLSLLHLTLCPDVIGRCERCKMYSLRVYQKWMFIWKARTVGPNAHLKRLGHVSSMQTIECEWCRANDPINSTGQVVACVSFRLGKARSG